MVASLPPRVQPTGEAAAGSSNREPNSNVGLGKKLPGRMVGGMVCTAELRATDKSSMTITPVGSPEPPETREQRSLTAPTGTNKAPFRFVNVESAMVPTHPGLFVPVVIKWVSPMRA